MAMSGGAKYLGAIVEYLDQGRLRPALVVREHDSRLGVLDASGREKNIARDLVLLRHPERRVEPANLAAALAEIDAERARLAAELDLDLLWEVVHEQNRPFTAQELAELFFGRRSAAATAVVLESLLNDRLYFTRRHMDFIARSAASLKLRGRPPTSAKRGTAGFAPSRSSTSTAISAGVTSGIACASSASISWRRVKGFIR